jgi:prevent-host-death family protein
MDEMTCTSATRGGLYEAIAKARWSGKRIVLTVRGEPAAVVIPLTDLAHLERAQHETQDPETTR